MTREEYINKMATLDRQRDELREEYIRSNVHIHNRSFVTLDGERLWLEKITIVGYNISPLLYRLTSNGSKDPSRRYYPKEAEIWRKLKLCKIQKPIKTKKNDEK
jgi:hypothetical protein